MIDIISLKALQGISYNSIDKNALIDVSNIKSENTHSILEKIESFLNEVTNPYIIKCGKTIVEVAFSDNEKTVESQTKNYLKSLLIQ